MPAWRYPLARPAMGDDEADAVREVLRSGQLAQAGRVAEFEAAVAAYVGARHAVACSSGTTALVLALWSAGVGAGDEVIVPALTFPAPAHAAIALGARPVPCDVDRDTWNLAPGALERALGSRTRAIIAVDQYGVPADFERILALAQKGKVKVVEDAACSLGSTLRGKRCGSFGDVATLSFHPRKVVTTGEGGMVLTEDAGMAERARSLRDHGRDKDGTFARPGLNHRLTEMAAAIGLEQMKKLDAMIAQRREALAVYRRHFGSASQSGPPGAEANGQSFGFVARSPSEAQSVIAALRVGGIEASRASFALDRQPSLRRLARLDQGPFTAAWTIADQGVALPLYAGLSAADAGEIADAVDRARSGGGAMAAQEAGG